MSNALAYGFTALTLGALLLTVLYTGARLRALLGLSRRWPLPLAIGAAVVFALVFAGLAARSTSATVGALYVASGYAFYLFLNLALALLCAHLAERVFKAPQRWSSGAAVVIAVAATVAGAIGAMRFSVVETPVALAGLKREVRVMQLSDLHLGHHRGAGFLARVVDETNRRRPDLVVITGDMIDSDAALRPGILAPFSRLQAPAYYVTGNHEKEIDTALALRRIADSGVRILHNRVVDVGPLQLVGLDYMDADEHSFNMHPSHETRTIRSTLAALTLRPGKPAVMLHHSPTGVQYAEAKGVGLVLAGHTHGGQFFPFNLVTPLLFPFDQGLYREGRTQVFVSPGAGTFMIRARLGVPGQINLLLLRPA